MRRSEIEAMMDRRLRIERKIASDLVLHTCKVFDVSARDLLSTYKYRFLTLPRFAMFMGMRNLGWSNQLIADVLGRDRTSVYNGVKKVPEYTKRDAVYAKKVKDIEQMAQSLYAYHMGEEVK